MDINRPPGTLNSQSVSELELIQTILGEDVDTDVLLQCLNQSNFDVATAVNLYFASLTVQVDESIGISNGMPIILKEFNSSGLISRHESFATITNGIPLFDAVTASNEKYRAVRFRKRGGSQGAYFQNGDVISIESHGHWLKCGKVSKYLRWRPACSSQRNKFVLRGLPDGEWLTLNSSFYLSCLNWPSRAIVLRNEKPVGLKPFNSSIHQCFLGLSKLDTETRAYFSAKFTERALEVLPRDTSARPPIETYALAERSSNKCKERPCDIRESVAISKLDQMVTILGIPKESKHIAARYLDGAGGNIEIALEHYFMSRAKNSIKSTASHALIPMPNPLPPISQPPNGFQPSPHGSSKELNASKPKSEGSMLLRNEKLPSESVQKFGTSYTENCSSHLAIENFEMLSVLGRGSFGAVIMVRYKHDGRIFAIKILKKKNMDSTDIHNAREERQILQRVGHPYVSSLVFAFQTPERLYLGMNYYAAGDLFYHLNARGKFPLRDTTLYAAELVLAISYLHDLDILFRDLKPSNIMLDSSGHVALVDFGLSKQDICSSCQGVNTLSGTRKSIQINFEAKTLIVVEYIAPEALVKYEDGKRSYGKSYDWWSLGIVLYEMLAGESPFYDDNDNKMLELIVNAPLTFPDDFDSSAKLLISEFLKRDPLLRLGSKSGDVELIKHHPFFKTIDWDKLMKREVEAHWKPRLTSDTDTRYVDPEFNEDESFSFTRMDQPSKTFEPIGKNNNRFSQFSFDFRAPIEKVCADVQ